MTFTRRRALFTMGAAAGLAMPYVRRASADAGTVNVYNWSDYIAEDTIANFEKETGIKVRYDTYDNNEILHAKLVAGNSGYDIVVPGAVFAKPQIEGGLLQPLDQIVLVAVTSAHRGESFQACEFLMDYLKTQAPFWKKETTPQGARWVDARTSDDEALDYSDDPILEQSYRTLRAVNDAIHNRP